MAEVSEREKQYGDLQICISLEDEKDAIEFWHQLPLNYFPRCASQLAVIMVMYHKSKV